MALVNSGDLQCFLFKNELFNYSPNSTFPNSSQGNRMFKSDLICPQTSVLNFGDHYSIFIGLSLTIFMSETVSCIIFRNPL